MKGHPRSVKWAIGSPHMADFLPTDSNWLITQSIEDYFPGLLKLITMNTNSESLKCLSV